MSRNDSPPSGSPPLPVEPRPYPDRGPLADQVIARLLATSDSVRRRLAEHVLQFGLTEPRVNLLRILDACGEVGSSQVEVATALGIGESSVCTLIERMRSDGLLYRFRAKDDRRKSLVVLTPEGESLLHAWKANYEQHVPGWIGSLSDEQCQLLLELLHRMTGHVLSRVETEGNKADCPIEEGSANRDAPSTLSNTRPATRWKEAG